MERVEELCCYYVALLRCVGLIHQNHHWVTNGNNFYGNHLLFERIYKTAVEDADLAAEKMIGLFGPDALDLGLQAQMMGKMLEHFSSGDPTETSLKVEEKFLDFSEKFYTTLEQEGSKMTLGLDDMLMSIASNREGACYLLKQNSTEGNMSYNSRMAARKSLLKRMQKLAQAPDMNEEQQALAAVKTNISSVLMRLTKGTGANFDLRAQRGAPSEVGKPMYNFTVILKAGGHEAAAKDQLQSVLQELIGKVPFFTGKVQSANVTVF